MQGPHHSHSKTSEKKYAMMKLQEQKPEKGDGFDWWSYTDHVFKEIKFLYRKELENQRKKTPQ